MPMVMPMIMFRSMSVATTTTVLAIQFYEIDDKQRSAWLEEIGQSSCYIFDGREMVICRSALVQVKKVNVVRRVREFALEGR